MTDILIIKTGALGDVVRTTSLLNALSGNIYWLTKEESRRILPEKELNVLTFQDDLSELKKIKFDLVLSLEEDRDCARLAAEVNKRELIGLYADRNGLNYTDNSAHWFDMSRVSKLGLTKANAMKKANRRSYQEHIFEMIGKKFEGEAYKIYRDKTIKPNHKLIGIEKRSGSTWPNKQWWGYDELAGRLEANGYAVRVFQQRGDIRTYLTEIAECNHVVCGDTLAMHLALANSRTCTVIFNCTSPQEIYDYGCMKKVVSPLIDKYFYATSTDPEVINSISLDEVYNALPLPMQV